VTRDEILLAQKEYLFPAVMHYFAEPLVITHAKDQFVYDADGKEYLDFFGGILVISVGHCNPDVNRKIHEQVDRLQHVSTLYATGPQVALARKIASITPEGKLTRSFFTNSGTEANEMAVLTSRCYTGSTEVIALRYSYHGRSSMTLAMAGQSTWRVRPQMEPGFSHAHSPYCYRCPYGLTYPTCDVRCAADVEETIRTTTSGRIAGFIAEPVQGTGGFVTPPKEYFSKVADIVRRYGGLFISDEVQSGWGRTGKWFGIEHYGVTPDIIVGAKGLGNGTPIGVTVTRPEIAEAFTGATISTFGGNPVSSTAAKAVLDFIDENNLRVNALETGAYLRARLEQLQAEHDWIGDVRGLGLMQGVELVRDRKTKEPATAETLAVLEQARQNGLLIGKAGMTGNVVRVAPPLNITRADVDEFVNRFGRALSVARKAA
jgi:4-aminobutyrate aminotransferase-like enzyme